MRKFRKGDKVRCVLKNIGSEWNKQGCMDYLLMGIHTIDDIDTNGDLMFKRETEYDYWYCKPEEFELVRKKGVLL
jgi:hypothetical protein